MEFFRGAAMCVCRYTRTLVVSILPSKAAAKSVTIFQGSFTGHSTIQRCTTKCKLLSLYATKEKTILFFLTCYVEVWRMSWGVLQTEERSCSGVWWQWIFLCRLPDGSRVNRLLLGWVLSFSIFWALCRHLTSLMSLTLGRWVPIFHVFCGVFYSKLSLPDFKF